MGWISTICKNILMSRYVSGEQNRTRSKPDNPVSEDVRLGVKETDFLLKLIMRSTFDGTEIETGNRVLQKLARIHKENLDET